MEITGWTIAFLLAFIVGVVGFVVVNNIYEGTNEFPTVADSAKCKIDGGSCTQEGSCVGTVLDTQCGEGFVCCEQAQVA